MDNHLASSIVWRISKESLSFVATQASRSRTQTWEEQNGVNRWWFITAVHSSSGRRDWKSLKAACFAITACFNGWFWCHPKGGDFEFFFINFCLKLGCFHQERITCIKMICLRIWSKRIIKLYTNLCRLCQLDWTLSLKQEGNIYVKQKHIGKLWNSC